MQAFPEVATFFAWKYGTLELAISGAKNVMQHFVNEGFCFAKGGNDLKLKFMISTIRHSRFLDIDTDMMDFSGNILTFIFTGANGFTPNSKQGGNYYDSTTQYYSNEFQQNVGLNN